VVGGAAQVAVPGTQLPGPVDERSSGDVVHVHRLADAGAEGQEGAGLAGVQRRAEDRVDAGLAVTLPATLALRTLRETPAIEGGMVRAGEAEVDQQRRQAGVESKTMAAVDAGRLSQHTLVFRATGGQLPAGRLRRQQLQRPARILAAHQPQSLLVQRRADRRQRLRLVRF
ncbi:MAG: hypothetical protein ACK55I_34890, partial [bacterium]